jgi:hypothetical protein
MTSARGMQTSPIRSDALCEVAFQGGTRGHPDLTNENARRLGNSVCVERTRFIEGGRKEERTNTEMMMSKAPFGVLPIYARSTSISHSMKAIPL